MNQQTNRIPAGQKITSKLLHWGNNDHTNTTNNITNNADSTLNHLKYDLIIASDCLFFRDFHDDLITTLLNNLTADGVILLLQPQRDGTLDQFVSKASVFFDILRDENYCDKVRFIVVLL